jgi:hypothetical protein
MSDVLRWVADQYRTRLLQIDREACHHVDLLMVRAGQHWICDETIINPDELMTSREIEERHGIRWFIIRDLAHKYGIEVRGKRGNSNLYRLGDVLSAKAAKKSSN